ncbi:family 78 glycoside hydrolase catalytic domain [Parabacteroides johnsonii]|uniref:family 78 glycoside hydrolase catalytic domain n=1 Tax=Parabacteroides johnsonii TaxID=387661 RepID=UPI001898AF74|nr:family 78 glycoside hydrolase catalytic domain [Parabacteroides johnsonii]
MVRCIVAFVFLFVGISSVQAAIPDAPVNGKIWNFFSHLGIDSEKPVFSWQIVDKDRNELQTAFEIIVSESEYLIDRNQGGEWQSGKVLSEETKVTYGGKPLKSVTKYWWKVRVWDRDHQVSPWSEKRYFVTGFLNTSDWDDSAKWICAPKQQAGLSGAKWIWDQEQSDTVVFQSVLELPHDRDVRSAFFSITGDSCYSFLINGSYVIRDFSQWKEVQHIDIRSFLHKSKNHLEIRAVKPTPKKGGVIARAEIRFDNHELLIWNTDSLHWKIGLGMESTPAVLGDVGREPWLLAQSKTLTINDRSPLFRKSFSVRKEVTEAYLFISGLGVFDASLNGRKITRQLIPPAWTDYDKTVNYVTYDVTSSIERGENVLGVMLGNGWFDYQTQSLVGRHGLGESAPHIRNYGVMRLKAQLNIKYEDGSEDKIVSDPSWKTMASPYTLTHVFGSEDYDARLEQKDWNRQAFADEGWESAQVIEAPKGKLIAQQVPPVVEQTVFSSLNRNYPESDVVVFDLGQNINGQFEILVSGPAGSSIKIIPGEVLEQGHVKPIAHRFSTYSVYTLKGEGIETWRLTFSTASFRYIEIVGVSDDFQNGNKPYVHDVRGYWGYSAAEKVGHFKTSDDRYNRIYDLMVNTLKNNFVTIHTDCPSYEKLGWLEVLANTATSYAYLFDVHSFWMGCIQNMIDGQRENGLIPNIVPDYTHGRGDFDDSPSWGTASFVIPWLQYLFYTDTASLGTAYQMMQNYLTYLDKKKNTEGFLVHGLGDWMATAGNQRMNVENAVYVHNLYLMSNVADILEDCLGGKEYDRKFRMAKEQYNRRFFTLETSTYIPEVQINQVLPLAFHLIPDGKEAVVMERLSNSIAYPDTNVVEEKKFGKVLPYHSTVGDIGATYLWRVLGDYGFSPLVEKMILQTDAPSYYNYILNGMTTMPEHWLVEQSRSMNHDMYAGIVEWFYRSVAGIRCLSPGFKTFSLKPAFELTPEWVECSYLSFYGKIESSWKKINQMIEWRVEIPDNTSAIIYVPVKEKTLIKDNGQTLCETDGIRYIGQKDGCLTYSIGSGVYNFSFPIFVKNNK